MLRSLFSRFRPAAKPGLYDVEARNSLGHLIRFTMRPARIDDDVPALADKVLGELVVAYPSRVETGPWSVVAIERVA